MLDWLKSLDRILRGETTSPTAIQDGNIQIPLRGLCVVGILLAMLYGACMGSFSVFREVDPSIGSWSDRYLQIFSTTLKVPTLFFLTLAITFPSLYVFYALVGSRLTLQSLLRLLLASLGVNLAVLASLGPIVAFFSVSTTSYNFMLLFNVLVFAVAGTLGLAFLIQTLNRISLSMQQTDAAARRAAFINQDHLERDHSERDHLDQEHRDQGIPLATEYTGENAGPGAEPTRAKSVAQPSALDRVDGNVLGRHVRLVFACWVVVFGLVGAQLGWVLRPFLGDPQMEFAWFRNRESNFFEGVMQAIQGLLGL